ncbi:MAG: hypothetical protein MNPFHGCM_03205 [Gemmatimonadaceae bacterium]|nr:hypothetical protein [Gemmatimonadaceae bacterium]
MAPTPERPTTLVDALVAMNRLGCARRALFHLAASATIAACGVGAPQEIGAFAPIDSPAAANSGESHLVASSDGTLHMTWLERLPDSTVALRYARRVGDAWDAPRTVTTRSDLFVNWADFPSVAVTSAGRLYVHWLQRSSASKYSYDVMLSQSADEGRTWSAPLRLHGDSSTAEHGFVSMLPMADSILAFWLDGNQTHPGGGAMQVHARSISGLGAPGTESVVDTRTCDCCQTAAAMSGRGPVVVYRDRSEQEIRDIVIARWVDGGWSEPIRVHDDDWHIEACPVNGPAVVAAGDTVVVAWFTGARDTAKVQVAWSSDGGATFGSPTRVDAGNPAGRVAMTSDGRGAVVVAWLERLSGDNAEVRARLVAPGADPGDPVVIARSTHARASGFPRLARIGERLFASWTAPGDSARIRLAVAPIGTR